MDRQPGQYLGHPTTVLLEDNKTLLCVDPEGHGKGPIRLRRSPDGGIVAMASVVPVRSKPGHYFAFFHDDGRFIRAHREVTLPVTFTVYSSESNDGGITWGQPRPLVSRSDIHLCEPGVIRSPDGRELAMLLRENSRRRNSWLMTSRDEGCTWSEPRELPAALTGDRHVARYTRDGRPFVAFRDMARESATKGDWVAWVGRYRDIVHGKEGQCRVRLMDNHHAFDCAYPAVEILPDDTLVTTTYGHWERGEPPFIVSVRLRLHELDQRLQLGR